jgi:hypothetical protein
MENLAVNTSWIRRECGTSFLEEKEKLRAIPT